MLRAVSVLILRDDLCDANAISPVRSFVAETYNIRHRTRRNKSFSSTVIGYNSSSFVANSEMPQTHEITELLQAWSDGDSEALAKLIPLVDHELKKVARAYLQRERPGHILQTTALMDEAFIRLMETEQISWHDRKQFYSLVARRMHQVLVDYARKQIAAKRGNRPNPVDLKEANELSNEASEELLMLHKALTKLATLDPRKESIVEHRYFGGLTLSEIADLLGVSKSTVERDWNLARAWLRREIYGETLESSET